MSHNSVPAFLHQSCPDFTKPDVFGTDFYCLWPTPRTNPVKKMKYYTPLGQKQSFCESVSHDRAITALKFPLFYLSLLGRLMPSLCALFLPPPQCGKADQYANVGRGGQKKGEESVRARSDMGCLVMSCVQASRVTAVVVTA